jgi:hypothetical protein
MRSKRTNLRKKEVDKAKANSMEEPMFYSIRFIKNDVYFLRLEKGQLTVVRELENAAKLNKAQADGIKQDLGNGWGEIEVVANQHVRGR